LTIITP